MYEACFFDKAIQTEPSSPKNKVSLGSWKGFNQDYTQVCVCVFVPVSETFACLTVNKTRAATKTTRRLVCVYVCK